MCTYVCVLVIAVGFIKSSLVESDTLATAQFTLLWFLSLHKYTDSKTLTCYLTASMINRSCSVEYDTLATAKFTLLWFLSLYKYTDSKILTCYLTASMINKSCSVECDTLATAKFTLFRFLSLYTYIYTDLLPDSLNDKKELFGGVWQTVHTVLVSLSIQIHIHWPVPWQREW